MKRRPATAADDAPLEIYATGIRNAYDLIWHSNGSIYVPTNGTAGGANSPGETVDGDPIDHDDLLDFHDLLETDDWMDTIQAMTKGVSG